METRTKAVSANLPLSPVAAARLKKLTVEIDLLSSKLRQAVLDERQQAGELLYLAEAQELVGAAMSAITNRIREQHKRLSVRLLHGTTQSIENAIRDDNDATLGLCVSAVSAVKTNRKL